MKRRERVQGRPPEWLVRLGEWDYRMRRRVADWLQLRAVALPLEVVKRIFYFYVFVGAMFFTMVLAYPDDFFTVPGPPPVKWPAMIHGGKGPKWADGGDFTRAMDSIRASAVLKRRLDSLIQARQGFADTMRQLEEYYK